MEKQLKLYLRRYRQDLLPAALILAALMLANFIILPQFNDIGDLRTQIDVQEDTNEGLRSSDSTLSSISDSQLDDDYDLVLSALPLSKSIGSIFEALNSAALRSNVVIGSLNVQVGTVYEQNAKGVEKNNVDGVPYLNILVRATGQSAADFTNFAQVLYESVPVVEINSIEASESDARFDVNFYFKPMNPAGFQAQTLVAPLNAQQQSLLSTLREWSL